MKILVTGATGFLGSHLCRRLVAAGHRVTILRRPGSDTALLAGLQLQEIIGDVTEEVAVDRAIHSQEVVFHTAAHLAYWRGLRAIQTQVNVTGTRLVAQSCLKQGVRRLVHVSTVAAIGIPPLGSIADESFLFNLATSGLNYHCSKWRAEAEVQQRVAQGLDAVIVNPATILGPHGRGFRGGEMLRKVHCSRWVSYYLGGINVVHVEDVVAGMVQALAQGRAGERYILGGENLTYRQLVEVTAQAWGLERVFVPVPPLVTGLAQAVLEPVGALTGKRPWITRDGHYCAHRTHFYDSSKATRELGYTARPFRAILWEYHQPLREHTHEC
ncbi:NAD-dependent epimerase/dehydratase family protein [Anthocerotibacter panamensis]|uniref:NAD-dependent epimerase/dehydratase family protein n=1 Tax=Anthocerotibacter panamensis TaxID=2857077 RepID=UPI001C40458D|nr:NAD-dependent epimerase/dehydratase family protein [Anthocerotibacter panamensis]